MKRDGPMRVRSVTFVADPLPCECAKINFDVGVLVSGSVETGRISHVLYVHCRKCGASAGSPIGKDTSFRVQPNFSEDFVAGGRHHHGRHGGHRR